MCIRGSLASVGQMGEAEESVSSSKHSVRADCGLPRPARARRLRLVRAGVLVAAFVLCAACGQSSGGVLAVAPPAGASGANLWVDANGGSCSRKALPAAYADAQACASLQAAAD